MSTDTLVGHATSVNGAELDTTIGRLLGQGLGYDDWKTELESVGGLTWTENLKNLIIKREFNFFKEEILTLQSQPNTARGLKTKTNSLESILKRLQGLEWVKGVPGEMEKRKRDCRLLGKDAKARCLQYHVSRWKSEASSSSPQPSTRPFISEFPDRIANTHSTETTSTTVYNTGISPAEGVSTGKNQKPEHSSKNNNFPVAKSLSFQTSVHSLNSGIPSLFGISVPLPDFDPTLSGDYQIPWVPLTSADIMEQDEADIPLEDFFRFFEQDPNFSSEAASEELSFELPRTDGINESYSTYIAKASQDPMAQTNMLEEIHNFYGSQPSKDIWLAGVSQENIHFSSDSYLEHFRSHCSQENSGVSPQDLTRTSANTDQVSESIDTEMQFLESIFSFDNFHEHNQEINQSTSPNRNESTPLASSIPKLPSRSLPDSSPCTGMVHEPQNNSLLHVSEELRRKRAELAAAQITVSKLLTEIKSLEASAEQESLNFEGMGFEDTLRPRRSHKRGNEETLHGAKRLKETEFAFDFEWEISTPPSIEDGEAMLLDGGHLPTEKGLFTRIRKNSEGAVQHASDRMANETRSTEAPKPCAAHATQTLGQPSLCKFRKTSLAFDIHAERCASVQSLSMQTLLPSITI